MMMMMVVSCDQRGLERNDTLKVGLLPGKDRDLLLQENKQLFDYLAGETGLNFELLTPGSYDELVALFLNGEIHMGLFGGYTFIKASQDGKAIPLVMREVDTHFTSVFLVKAEDTASTLADLKGKRFTFGSRLSTSGHLMPRFFMGEMGIDPETFFGEVRYSGAHDLSAFHVRDGIVDACVLNAAEFRHMLREKRLADDEVGVLWETPPYADYVWAVRPDLDETLTADLRDAFLALSPHNPQHRPVLEKIRATYFLPASPSDFSELKEIVHAFEKH